VVAVTEGGDGEEDVRGAGAIEDSDTAAGAVGAAVVEVQEEGGLAEVAGDDLGGEGGEDAAGGGVVGGVIGNGLVRRIW